MFRTPFSTRLGPERARRSLLTVPLTALAALALLLGVSAPAQAAPAPVATTLSAFGDAVASTAASLAGSPYRYGGTTPAGFDCSGYVGYVYKQHGKALPRTAGQMRAALPGVDPGQVQAGDVVFVQRGGRVTHVAIVGVDGRWWEATRPGKPVGAHNPWSSSVSFGRP